VKFNFLERVFRLLIGLSLLIFVARWLIADPEKVEMFDIFIGQKTPVTILEQQETEVGSSGGTIAIKDLAQLNILPMAMNNARVRLAVVDFKVNPALFDELGRSFHLITGPKVQVRISKRVSKSMRLMLKIEKPDPDYKDCEIQFVRPQSQVGESGSEGDGLFSIGGSRCKDGNFGCATIVPEQFLNEDLKNPESLSIHLIPAYYCFGTHKGS
jgi:hypothetical protein